MYLHCGSVCLYGSAVCRCVKEVSMNNELFLKRFGLFRTLAVGSAAEMRKWCSSYGNVCTVSECEDLESLDLRQPPQLLLLFAGDDPKRAEACMKRLGDIPFWQRVLFCDDPEDPSMMELAIRRRFFSLNRTPAGREELTGVLAAVLPSLIEKFQESGRAAQLHKMVEMGPAKILFGGSGQVLYINARAKKLFGIEKVKEAAPKLAELFAPLNGSGSERVVGKIDYEGRQLVVCKDEERSSKETLFTVLEPDPSQSDETPAHVTRLEFIDRMKDKMAQRIDMSVPLVLLTVRMKNYAQIVEDFDWIAVHTIQKELNELLLKIFDTFEAYGLWQPDMALVLFEEISLEELKKRVSFFITQVNSREFHNDIVPSLEFTLIEIGSTDLNAMINLIEKEYSGSITVSDTKEFDIYKTSSSEDSREDADVIWQFLANIMAGRLPLKLMNIYKGLPISTPTKILKMEEDKIIVTAEKIQKFVMESEKETVLQSPHLPSDLHADVHFVDASRPLAILKHLRTMKTSVNNRKHTRVTVTSRLPITLKLGKSHYTGYVYDISINSIAILFNLDKFEENELKGRQAEVSFKLPWENEEGFVNITVRADILFNRNEKEFHKVVVLLEPDDICESYIFDYIYKRQKELIKELKSRL